MTDEIRSVWLAEADPLAPVVDVQWPTEGDEWLHHLSMVMRQQASSTSHSTKTRDATAQIPAPHIVFALEFSVLRSRLILLPLNQGGMLVFVEGDEFSTSDQIDPWTTAVREASTHVGRSHHEFSWTAVIGPAPGIEAGSSALGETTTIGNLYLQPGGSYLKEMRPSRPPSLFSVAFSGSWPLVVSGKSTGYNWNVAALAASQHIHRLCTLLSVVWDRCWILREGPRPHEWGPVSIPENPTFQKHDFMEELVIPDQYLHVPEWAGSAWAMLEDNQGLAHALAAHYEGLQLQDEHPSFALIAFVGAIEGIGAQLHDLERCKACGSQVGAAKRFRQALALVRPDDQVAALSKAYTSRSQTAHAGRLHGDESVFGVFGPPAFLTPDSASDFKWGVTWRMRGASRDLLRLVFAGGLPSTSPM